jgi:hypothetical protein
VSSLNDAGNDSGSRSRRYTDNRGAQIGEDAGAFDYDRLGMDNGEGQGEEESECEFLHGEVLSFEVNVFSNIFFAAFQAYILETGRPPHMRFSMHSNKTRNEAFLARAKKKTIKISVFAVFAV